MAICSWHHTYKVTYRLKGDVGSGKRVTLVEAASVGMAMQQVVEENGGPLNCMPWSAVPVD